MIDPTILRAMMNAGCTAEQIVAVAEEASKADEAKRLAKRAGNAERQRRHRERNALSRVTGVTNGDTPPPNKKEKSPHTPLKEKTITPSPFSVSVSAGASDFETLWSIYPNKIGKRKAADAFSGARKRADFETIMAGLHRYIAKTDDRPWCNPATWLNQDRWADDPAAPVATLPRSGAPPNRKPTVVDAMNEIFRERGWTDEPEQLPGNNGDGELVSPGFGGGTKGTVVDLREGAWRRTGSGD
jgi:hypothetical protein